MVAPDAQCEGESRGDALSMGDAPTTGVQPNEKDKSQGDKQRDGDSLKRKRAIGEDEKEEKIDHNIPQKTQGKHVDYCYLNNPFSDREEEDDINAADTEAVNAVEAEAMLSGDDPKSLDEAKKTSEWPEWEQAIKTELNQLDRMKTWTLVKRPVDTIPITNKWVFTKKYSKSSELLKYKARLVAKGCAQRLGYDYLETFSPVVRMETIRAILAIVAIKGFIIQQMDIKGAYLNGTLKETVYMQQPEGYDDKSGRVCLLVKTLYGLKQSGREWNRELDQKLRKHGFMRLKADPCAYLRKSGNNLEIITVWVDDLLLFATSEKLMATIKNDLHSEWEVTDMGEPAKIVSIEITWRENSITISQTKYIEAILEREGMRRANPVAMPMDLGIILVPNPDGNIGD